MTHLAAIRLLCVAYAVSACGRRSIADDGGIPDPMMEARAVTSKEGRFKVDFPSICPQPYAHQIGSAQALTAKCAGGTYEVRYVDEAVAPVDISRVLAEREKEFVAIVPETTSFDVTTGSLGAAQYRRFRVQQPADYCVSVLFVSAGKRFYEARAGARCAVINPRTFIDSFALLPP